MIISQIESKEPKSVHPILAVSSFWSIPSSILGALLFSIFLADLFFIVDATDIVSYAISATTLHTRPIMT